MDWRPLCTAFFLACPFVPASAMSTDESSLPGVVILSVTPEDAPPRVIAHLQWLLDDGRRTVLSGDPAVLAKVRPSFASVWPYTNTLVLDPAAGLGVFGFNAVGQADRLANMQDWPWSVEARPGGRGVRSAVGHALLRQVHFSLTAKSPSQVCRHFSAEMMAVLFDDRSPSQDEFRAFRRETRRWCQYGNLSQHAAARPQFVIAPFRNSSLPRLSLSAEWALVRSEDPLEPDSTSYLFWARTMGEGGGTGFTMRDGMQAWIDPETGELRDVMDVAIHSGWGSVESPDVVTAWPLNSTFPHTGDMHVFRCDGPSAFYPRTCPTAPVLRKLYPDDTFGGKATASVSHGFTFGGEAKLGAKVGGGGPAGAAITFGLQALRHDGSTSQAEIPLVHTRSNAASVYYRSTWWTPNVPAIFRWAASHGAKGLLGGATPLASTLNPRHDILWELPMLGNASRALPYHVVYEMGLNTCSEDFNCMGRGAQGHPRSKARVGWMDSITVHVPSY